MRNSEVSRHFFSPFSLEIDKMEHLVLINFEKDTDEYYNVFELQQAVGHDNIKRFLVIAYRKDGKADIYHQPEYPFASQSSILNDVSFFEVPMDDLQFRIDPDEIFLKFSFTDKLGRQILVELNEKSRSKKEPFFLLAPVGVVSKKPTVLPVYSLYEMSFTQRKHTRISINIDNKSHKPDKFFLPIDGARNYFSRYSLDTFNVDLNRNFEGILNPVITEYPDKAYQNGVHYELASNNGSFEICRIKTQNVKHELSIDFTPHFPDITNLADLITLNGEFRITTDHTKGNLSGNYIVNREANLVTIKLHPKNGWQPNETRFLLRLLYKMVKIFRDWPASYVWEAQINLDNPTEPYMKSSWKRV